MQSDNYLVMNFSKFVNVIWISVALLSYSCVIEDDTQSTYQNLLDEEEKVKKIPLADPFILVSDNIYYAYGTSISSVGYSVYYSSDLKKWTLSENPALNKNDVYGSLAFWAPEVYKTNEAYYMYYTANYHTGVAKSVSPLGPFVQENQRFILNEICDIDPSILLDGNSVYMYYAIQGGIRVVKMKSYEVADMAGPSDCFHITQSWWEGGTVEAPSVVKVGGKYIMTYSGASYYNPEYGVGVAVADDPMGPWEKYEGNPIMQYPVYKGAVLQGTGHNSLFKDLDGNWRMVFHAHSAKGIEGGRYMYIVSVDLLDHPPYIVFHDDLFAPVLAEEDATEGSTGTK